MRTKSRIDCQKKSRDKIRMAVLSILGSKCLNCGFSDVRALQIDHINGGGAKERKSIKSVTAYYKHIIDSVIKGEYKYQLLCANCNVIKRIINQEHKKS